MSEIQAAPIGRMAQIRSERSSDPRAVRSRRALHDALLELLKSTSFERITPRQIADKAGFAHATFYRHYPSKEAILNEFAREEMIHMIQSATQVLDQAGLKNAALALCEYVDRKRALWSILLNGGAYARMREEILSLARTLAAQRAVPRDRLPPELGVVFACSAVVEIVAWWLRQETRHSSKFVAGLLTDLVLKPLKKASSFPSQAFPQDKPARAAKQTGAAARTRTGKR
jgi:AcrR family transcriptional regulator